MQKYFKHEILGYYERKYSCGPSVNCWLEQNKSKGQAIKIFIEKLQNNGWNPIITISEEINHNNYYCIITCNLTD